MAYTIAIAGKGGVGKTTIAALIVRLLRERKRGSILAVDADPNSNLAEYLGVKPGKAIGSILDEIARNPGAIPAGMTKDRYIDLRVNEAIQEEGGFDVLAMGRPEGPGCYCYVNNVLRGVVGKAISSYDYCVIDNEAGFEHLSRRTTRIADILLIVSDPTEAGMRAAKRIAQLSSELDLRIGKKFLILNRANSINEVGYAVNFDGVAYLGSIPQDNIITELSYDSDSISRLSPTSVSLNKLREIAQKLWDKN